MSSPRGGYVPSSGSFQVSNEPPSTLNEPLSTSNVAPSLGERLERLRGEPPPWQAPKDSQHRYFGLEVYDNNASSSSENAGHHIDLHQSSHNATLPAGGVAAARRSYIKQHQSGYVAHHLPAYVNDIFVSAFPDSCSALNIISEQFAHRHKFPFDTKAYTTLTLPDHRTVSSIGSLYLTFRFARESETFDIFFSVLRGCVYDLVLSTQFLRETEVFTTFKSRIERRFLTCSTPSIRVCLQGITGQRVFGSINGHIVSASPDTGSDVNVILKSHAIFLGLVICSDAEAIETLEYIDGSCVQTCGIVRNVEWQYGRHSNKSLIPQRNPASDFSASSLRAWEYGADATRNDIYVVDLYVVESLVCPLILNSDLLYGTNAFAACAPDFYDNNAVDDKTLAKKLQREDSQVCVLTKKRKEGRLGELCKKIFPWRQVDPAAVPASLDTSLCPSEESDRRGKEEDRIAEIHDPIQQAAEWEEENRRKEKWDRDYAAQSLLPVSSALVGAQATQQMLSAQVQPNSQPPAPQTNTQSPQHIPHNQTQSHP